MAGEDRTANVVLTADTTAYTQQMTSAASSTNQVTESLNRLLTSVDRVAKTTGKGLVIISATTTAGIVGATAAAAKFESQVSSLAARATAANQAFGPIQRSIDGLRRSLPVSTEQVVALTNALQKLGTNPSQLKNVADTLIRLAGATGEDLGTLATNMVQLQRAMGTGSSGIKQYSDLLVNLSAKMGTSAASILEFSNAIAPIGRTLAMSQQEVMGFSAAFAKAGQDGYRAANIFTRMLSDISTATRYGTSDLSMYASLVGKTVEQFKAMGSTNQVVSIFEALNRGGSGSIKTLERMGYEGARALKTIQGTVQSGGMAEAMNIANNPNMQNGSTLEKSASEAFKGLNDTIKIIRNNLTSLTQAFGAQFLPIITKVAEAVAGLTKNFVSMLEPLQPIMAAIGGVGAAGAGVLGGALQTLGPIAAAGGAYALFRNSFGAGRAGARMQATGMPSRVGTYNNAYNTFRTGGGSPMGRALYALGMGTRRGNLYDAMGTSEPSAVQRRMYGAGRILGMMTPRGLMISMSERSRYARALFNKADRLAQEGGGGRNLFRRGMMMATAGAAGTLEMSGAFVDPARLRNINNLALRGTEQWGDVKRAWAGVRDPAGAGSVGNSMRILGSAVRNFTRTVMSANVGMAKLAVSAAGAAGGAMLRGVGRGIMNLAGGPTGLAIMGITGVAMAASHYRQEQDAFGNALAANDGGKSAYNTYATSLGLAGAAAQSFAGAIGNATAQVNMSLEKALQWNTNQVEVGRSLTNKALENMDERQARAYVASALSNSTADPRVIAEMQKDIQQKFGVGKGRDIWDSAKRGSINNGDLYMDYSPSVLPWDASNSLQEGLLTAADTQDVMSAEISKRGYGQTEQLKLRVASVNNLLKAYSKAKGDPDRNIIKKQIADTIGVAPEELDNSVLWGGVNKYDTEADVRGSVTRQLFMGAGVSPQLYQSLTTEEKQALEYSFSPAIQARNEPMALKMRKTRAGQMFWGQTDVGETLRTGAFQEGNSNANISAARLMAQRSLRSSGGDLSGATQDLQRFKAAIGDLSNPMAVLATAAQKAAQAMMSFNMTGATSGQRVGQNIANLRGAAAAPMTDEYETNLDAARQTTMQDFQNYDARVRSMVKAGRSFNQSRQWSQEAFYLNYSRQRTAFYKQQDRQESDFRRQQKWSQEDFDKARRRGLQDFNISRERSEYQFNLSRRYAEEDFNHQKELMAEQTSKQMADIYQRLTVRPTWDAQNLSANAREQATTFRQQLSNLKKLRKMGISSESIKMLGLNDPSNAQQVARMTADLESSPELVGEFNQIAQERLDISKQFVFDADNTQWQEMERSFQLANQRNADAFKLSMDQMDEDYKKSLDRQDTDYKTSLDRQELQYKEQRARANADFVESLANMEKDFATSLDHSQTLFNQQFEEITGDLVDLEDEALGMFSGVAKTQLEELQGHFATMTPLIATEANKAGLTISEAFEAAFVDPYKNLARYGAGWDYMSLGKLAAERRAASGSGGGGGEMTVTDDAMSFTTGRYHSPVPPSIKMGTKAAQLFGASRDGGKRKHEGVDFPAPTGTPIYAFAPGIAYTMWSPTGGNVTSIAHGNGMWSNYLHQSSRSIMRGDHVDAGQLIGKVGNTGSASRGSHLHFEVRRGGQWGAAQDPNDYLGLSGGSMGGATDGNAPLYMSRKNKQDWSDFVAGAMTPVENSVQRMAHAAHQLPYGSSTMGTLYATTQGLNNLGFLGEGAIFNRSGAYGVGERGSEVLLPLDNHGADFLADVMTRFARGIDVRAQGMETVAAPTTYNYRHEVDSSVNFTGDVHVESNDPNEMARKLEEKARLNRLVKR